MNEKKLVVQNLWRKETDMEIKVEDFEDKKIVTPIGEIDMSTSVELRSTLLKILRQKPSTLIISLEKITYIDSSGLATLIECMQEMEKFKGKLKLIIAEKRILDVFKLARLDRVFDISEEKTGNNHPSI